jgi:hypothetical protein
MRQEFPAIKHDLRQLLGRQEVGVAEDAFVFVEADAMPA